MDQLSAAGFSDDEVKILKDFANSKNSESWMSTHLGTDKITSEGDDLVESILKSKKSTSGYSTPKVLDAGITSAPKEMGTIHGTHVKTTITENVIGSGVSSEHPMFKHLASDNNVGKKTSALKRELKSSIVSAKDKLVSVNVDTLIEEEKLLNIKSAIATPGHYTPEGYFENIATQTWSDYDNDLRYTDEYLERLDDWVAKGKPAENL